MGYVGNQTTTAFTSMAKQDITGDGGTGYTLDHAVANAQEIEVFVNNVRQEPGTAYTVSGTTLTMTGNVASTDDFYVVYQGKAIQTSVPGDNTVTTAMLQDDAVTGAKIADDAVTSAKLATNIAIDGTLGVGETSPLGTVHIKSGDASLTNINTNADDLILENNGNCGMTICSSTTGEGNINFVDSGDTNIGRIQYHHNTNEMQFRTNDGVRMEITSNGNFLVDSEANTAILAKHQILTGTATAAGSNSYKKVIRCGHTFSGRVSVIALQSFGVGSASANFTASVSYGSPSVTRHNNVGGGNITSIAMQYNNGGSPNYTFDIAVTYTGSAPTLYVTVSANSHTEMYII